MALKTKVKVGNISNLSDARYCSGMGVDWLGFSAIEGKESYISPTLYQELRGWIAGPQAVVQLYGISDKRVIPTLLEEYRPDYFELNITELNFLPRHLTVPLIVSIQSLDQLALIQNHDSIHYVEISEINFALIHHIPDSVEVLVKIKNSDNLQEIIKHPRTSGISLLGTSEIRPGYKDYDDLAEVLELLELE